MLSARIEAAPACAGVNDVPAALLQLLELENLSGGTILVTRDGGAFIRTDRVCAAFCDLQSGALCSAKDLLFQHGGLGCVCVPACLTGRPNH